MFRKQFVNRLYNVGAATCHEFVRLFSTQPGQRLEGKWL